MTDDQRAEWGQALADAATARRRGRHRRKRGFATVTRAGMVRVNQPQPKE